MSFTFRIIAVNAVIVGLSSGAAAFASGNDSPSCALFLGLSALTASILCNALLCHNVFATLGELTSAMEKAVSGHISLQGSFLATEAYNQRMDDWSDTMRRFFTLSDVDDPFSLFSATHDATSSAAERSLQDV